MSKFKIVVGKGITDEKALKSLVSRLNILKTQYKKFVVFKMYLIKPARWVAVCEIE